MTDEWADTMTATARHYQDTASEDDLLTTVTNAMTRYGWLWTHPRRSDKALTMGHPGVPDIIAVRDGRVKFFELKTAKGQLTEEQWAWGFHLPTSHNLEYRVVRPADLDDVIESLR